MSLNAHVETPPQGEFSLENLGLSTQLPMNEDGVIGIQSQQAPNAVINTDMTAGADDSTSLSTDEIENITDWNTKVRILKDKTNKLVDMKDIQKDIETKDVISADKADLIEATFEGYYGSGNQRFMYTDFDSKTNLEKAKRFMEQRIQSTMEALVSEFRQINTDSVSELAKAILETKEFCSEELRDCINDSINKLEACAVDLEASTIVLPFYGDRFIDMKEANLIDIDISEIKQGVPVSKEFSDCFAKLQCIWKNNAAVRNAIATMANANTCAGGDEVSTSPECLDLSVIMRAFVASSSHLAYNDLADEMIQTECTLQESSKKLEEALDGDKDLLIEVIQNEGMDLLNQSEKVAITKQNAQELAEFAKCACTVVLGLISLR